MFHKGDRVVDQAERPELVFQPVAAAVAQQREPHPVCDHPALGNKTPVEVIMGEEPLQLRKRRSAYETAIRRPSPAARLDDHDREP